MVMMVVVVVVVMVVRLRVVQQAFSLAFRRSGRGGGGAT